MRIKHNVKMAALGGALGLAGAWLFTSPSDLELEQRGYCQMVELRKNDPTGQAGWPDYENSYDEVCNAAR